VVARLHALDLVAIQVETVRHQLGAATILRESDAGAAQENVSDAQANLAELDAVGNSGMDLADRELTEFVDSGIALATAVEQQSGSDVLDANLQSFAAAHETLARRIDTDRVDSIDSVDSTNRLLSRFGAFGGGLTAFIVPLSALYVQRRVGQRRLASYEYDADLRWMLAVNELTRTDITGQLEECLDHISTSPALAEQQLRTLIDRLELDSGSSTTKPEPTDVVDLFSSRPELPGLRRSVRSDSQPICQTDPNILTAAFTSIEWAVSRAGADELILISGQPKSDWQQFEIRGEGGIDAFNLPEIAGPIRTIETALASTGLPVTSDEDRLRWTIDFPLAEPVAT